MILAQIEFGWKIICSHQFQIKIKISSWKVWNSSKKDIIEKLSKIFLKNQIK
jgi:hypothetical protein